MDTIIQDESSPRIGATEVAVMPDAGALIGHPTPRVEDARLVRGQSRYVSDLAAGTDTLHMAIVRSPQAHAHIRSVVDQEAVALDGVVAVLTAKDLDGIKPLPCDWVPPGMKMVPQHPILAKDTVRYTGEPVAAVIATSKSAARAGRRSCGSTWTPWCRCSTKSRRWPMTPPGCISICQTTAPTRAGAGRAKLSVRSRVPTGSLSGA